MYAYTGARLAAGVISFEGVGPEMDPAKIVTIAYSHSTLTQGGKMLVGDIPVLDPQYGNVWTNIDAADFAKMQPGPSPATYSK